MAGSTEDKMGATSADCAGVASKQSVERTIGRYGFMRGNFWEGKADWDLRGMNGAAMRIVPEIGLVSCHADA